VFTSVLLQPGLNKREDGLTINKGDTRESTYLKRWEWQSLKNFQNQCEDNNGKAYFISAIGRKKVGSITYTQTFRDTNVVCIPSIEDQGCSLKDHKALMEVRAQECAKNYMTSCDFGIRDVIIVNQNANLDTMGSGTFGYDLSPAMTQSGEENKDFFVIATANWGMINTPYATLVLFVCLACQITQMTIF
jgi:hypothetical protein